MIFTPRALDAALDGGRYYVSKLNERSVTCARCGATCPKGGARRVRLGAWAGRAIYLCLARCCPKL